MRNALPESEGGTTPRLVVFSALTGCFLSLSVGLVAGEAPWYFVVGHLALAGFLLGGLLRSMYRVVRSTSRAAYAAGRHDMASEHCAQAEQRLADSVARLQEWT